MQQYRLAVRSVNRFRIVFAAFPVLSAHQSLSDVGNINLSGFTYSALVTFHGHGIDKHEMNVIDGYNGVGWIRVDLIEAFIQRWPHSKVNIDLVSVERIR